MPGHATLYGMNIQGDLRDQGVIVNGTLLAFQLVVFVGVALLVLLAVGGF